MKAYLAYSRSFEVVWRAKGCVGRFLYNAATGDVHFVHPRSIRSQKRTADGSFINSKVGKALARFRKAQLWERYEANRAAEAPSVQLDEPVPLSLDNVFVGGDDGDDAHAEPISDLHNLSDQAAGGVPALQYLQSAFEKA